MTSEQDHDTPPAALLERILDQACIDTGMEPEELERAKIVAQIEVRLVAEGRSIKDIYAEWAESTPAKIIEKYSYKLKEDKKDPPSSISIETNKLYVHFIKLKHGHPPTAYLRVNDPDNHLELPQDTLKLPVAESLLDRFSSFKEGQPLSIQMLVSPTVNGPELTVVDVNLEKQIRQTFTRSLHP